MYCETVEPKRGKMSDIAVIMTAFVIILMFEPAVVFVNLPQSAKTIAQSLLVIAVVVFCLWFYKKRLCSYRYTLITDREDVFGELEETPESFRELEFGTLLIESSVGNGRGTYLTVAAPSEMTAFYESAQTAPVPKSAVRIKATLGKRENACVLLYEQEGRQYAVFFSPSAELRGFLQEMLSTKKDV